MSDVVNMEQVLFMYQPLDDFVMKNLQNFNGRKLISIESSEASSEHDDKKEKPKSDIADDLIKFFSNALAAKVSHVSSTDRLVDSPAVIVDHQTASYRRMMMHMVLKHGINRVANPYSSRVK